MKRERPEVQLEYFFTDTGSELPEVYEYLSRLEAFLGQSIARLNPEKQFKEWLREYKHFLPSVQQRWCTRQLKLRPFEDWIRPTLEAGGRVVSYVAIRADEDRSGYRADTTSVEVEFPLREAGLDKMGVIRLLRDAGLDLPDYYRWRSRSGCTFCFFQQKIEWVRLQEEHPKEFEKAKALEKSALEHGSPFTWSQGESLEELARPERQAQIRADFERRLERSKRAARDAWRLNPFLDATFTDEQLDQIFDMDDLYGRAEVASSCVVCHK
jgi:3'-phosphoadenosine 5'-phosphosulfate sulfotransferase (PAPS reductase)/FAD synthetase